MATVIAFNKNDENGNFLDSTLQSDADDLDEFLPESNGETLATLAHALDSQDTIKNEESLVLQDLGLDILPNGK